MEPFRFAITDEMRVVIDRLRSEDNDGFDDRDYWIMLSVGPFAGYLTQDGRVVGYDAWGGGDWVELVEQRDACFLVSTASDERNSPELLHLLPPRPNSAINCSSCGGMGRESRTNWVCVRCGGLGWIRANEEGRR